jgi:hypothetical protein
MPLIALIAQDARIQKNNKAAFFFSPFAFDVVKARLRPKLGAFRL